jgi:hypothetical protein
VSLDCCHTQVTDAGLKYLAALSNLQWLDLSGTKVSDTGLNELAGLKQLKTLRLNDTQVTDAGLKGLANLKTLTTLEVKRTNVTDKGLADLQNTLPSLGKPANAGTGDSKAELQAAAKLKLGKMLQDDGVVDKAKIFYQEIIKEYPKTKAADEAAAILKKLDK